MVRIWYDPGRLARQVRQILGGLGWLAGVVGGDAVGVEGLAEEDLPGEGAVGALGDGQLGAVGVDLRDDAPGG